jgi:hypothetical protein
MLLYNYTQATGQEPTAGNKEAKMATVRKPAALVAAEKRIVELEKKLAEAQTKENDWFKRYQEQSAVVDGLHEVLDELGIKGFKGDNQYQRLPLPVRLFAWAMKLAGKEQN